MTNPLANENLTQQPLPLQAVKQPNYKIMGIFLLLIIFFITNYFIFYHVAAPKKVTESESYQLPLLKPVTPEVSLNTLPDSQEDAALKQKLEEAKASDFITRLQATQGGVGQPTSEGTSQKAELNGDIDTSMKLSDPNSAFLVQASNTKAEHVYATHFGPLPYVIGQGRFIFGSLATAIQSDLPGQITATVSRDVYGEQGRKVLIPRGSLLIGEYKSGLANNQTRLFVVWTRLREPNGLDINLGSPGTDALGRAGLSGSVDNHFFARFGSATLVAILGAGASVAGVHGSDQYNSAAQYRTDVSQALSQQTDALLNQNMSIPPTLNVPQGSRIVVFVNRDLDFSKVYR